MKIDLEFGKNKKVKCHFNGFTVESDQSVADKGDGEYPEPFDYFLCSSALCAGIYIKNYLETRNIDIHNIKITQENVKDEKDPSFHHFKLKVTVPADLDDRHKKGIIKAAQLCGVKKAISAGANFEIIICDN